MSYTKVKDYLSIKKDDSETLPIYDKNVDSPTQSSKQLNNKPGGVNRTKSGAKLESKKVSQVTSNIAKLPKRTTKVSQKLAFFPEQDFGPTIPDDESEDEVYNQVAQIPEGTFRKQAVEYSKRLKQKLPRVTAYTTAASYKLDELLKYLQSLKQEYTCNPKKYDECLHTTFNFTRYAYNGQHTMTLSGERNIFSAPSPDNIMTALDSDTENTIDIAIPGMGELFFFEYGVVVMWGLTFEQEQEILKFIKPFEEDNIDNEDIECEEFHFHYNSSYQPKIYNDVITLKSSATYLTKMTISHAIAQSTKMAYFENMVTETIEDTKHIPQTLAETGKVNMSRTSIAKKIGQLYIMKINVNLVSNVLDTPEIFWSEPQLQPLYNAIRGYLEIPQRAELLNQRVDVICDMLDMLREHLNSSHGEFLEWIVIILIGKS
ncbi:Sad1-interacting factor 2 [Neoconidiobolus thromboides FSU 785]|nr:Sad1-interacting factor 2 [Neoconidiobolus thromboides FSU 785]